MLSRIFDTKLAKVTFARAEKLVGLFTRGTAA